jgi:hypothetical protein
MVIRPTTWPSCNAIIRKIVVVEMDFMESTIEKLKNTWHLS